jgi:hypothetical protein
MFDTKRWSIGLVAVACMSSTGAAQGQAEPSPEDRAAAEALFLEGRRLIKTNEVDAACRKFEESYRLESAPGTLLNVAHCHMLEGKVATAWTEFYQVATEARRSGSEVRERIALKSIGELEPRLPKLVIRVTPQPSQERLEVRRNGTLLRRAALNTETPIDPGPVVIQVGGEGFMPWSTKVSAREGAVLVVQVPVLERRAVPPSSAPPRSTASSLPPPQDRGNPTAQTTGMILGGAGLLSLGVGTFFGVRALEKQSESDDLCPVVAGEERCSQEGVVANQDARDAARFANIGIGVGVVAVLAGAYLYIDGRPGEPAEQDPDDHVAVSVAALPGGAGAVLRGGW